MSFYVRVWARPMGAEPKLFTTKEEAEVLCSCDPKVQEEVGCDPWCQPDIREFETEFEAWRWMKEFYPMCYAERKELAKTTESDILLL